MSFRVRLVAVCVFSINLIFLSGCIGGATPMVKRERGPSGEQLAKDAFDPTLVQTGVWTREEVLAKYWMINTGVEHPRFFWGRWASSKWGYMFAVGGYGAAAGDAGRVWSMRNLLVTFDEKGVAQKTLLVDDTQQLWDELRKQLATNTAGDETFKPIALSFKNIGDYWITFAADEIEVKREFGKIRTARFSPKQIVRLSHTYPDNKRNHPASTCHVMHLTEKTDVGQKITFCADATDVAAIFRYMQRYGLPEMKWE